jgi:hypothetical protein
LKNNLKKQIKFKKVKSDIGYNVWKIQPESKTNCKTMFKQNGKQTWNKI